MLDRKRFIDALTDRFPDLKEDLLDADYCFSIGLQIGCFKRYTQTAIDEKNVGVIKKCFSFVDSVIDKVTKDIENSLYISYLNHLDFSNNEGAKKYLSNKLLSIVTSLDNYSKSMSAGKANRFLNGLEE